ncbi:hypothetical protein GB937_004222 [Aspergillus fischeri]|nr:hypothetical protein GB937_004222 [Aspergillus fischeri]
MDRSCSLESQAAKPSLHCDSSTSQTAARRPTLPLFLTPSSYYSPIRIWCCSLSLHHPLYHSFSNTNLSIPIDSTLSQYFSLFRGHLAMNSRVLVLLAGVLLHVIDPPISRISLHLSVLMSF